MKLNNGKFAVFYVTMISVVLAVSLYASSLNGANVFTWSKEQQRIVNGTLRMKFSFEWQNESLNIIVKINDNKLCPSAYLGLVFDRNGNGKIDWDTIDLPYALFASNITFDSNHVRLGRTGASLDHSFVLAMPLFVDAFPSPYHTHTLTKNGCLYTVSIPRSELADVKANEVLVIYWSDSADMSQWPYHDVVSVVIKGWQ